eukprot:gnl/TRDRNA2_/TRDRNA2_174227_c0_seq1.p1 gnl/TRDRNA2_/TRDRNA2_174227_c0~~gnl/TRDRNA2_/TRDRNA2_174227_c0_seq1.p1  ORF type:complete len:351 (+),score=-9.91 gnl/TRDRNA2_/TRDRNA2_174227_c0_seq1:51-1103(+)
MSSKIFHIKESSDNMSNLIYDRVIRIFLEKESRQEWRKILAFSKNWKNIAHKVFERMANLEIEQSEEEHIAKLLAVARTNLSILHDELCRYDKILEDFTNAMPSEYDFFFAKHQLYIKKPFFDHIRNLIYAAWNRGDKVETEMLHTVATKIYTLDDAYKRVLKKRELMKDAIYLLYELLNSVSSIDQAEEKIDDLAKRGNLDAAFTLVVSKVYASISESPHSTNELKDVSMHLYFRVQEQVAKAKPPEVKILKYMLTLEDPIHIENALTRSLAAPQRSSLMEKRHKKKQAHLFTCHEKLYSSIKTVLKVYQKNQINFTPSSRLAHGYNPVILKRLVNLQKILESRANIRP